MNAISFHVSVSWFGGLAFNILTKISNVVDRAVHANRFPFRSDDVCGRVCCLGDPLEQLDHFVLNVFPTEPAHVDHQDNTHDRTHRAIAQLFCPNKYSLESVCMDGSVNAIQDRQNLQCWTLDTRKVQY